MRAELLARANKHRGIRAACLAGVVLWSAVEELDRGNRAFLSRHLVSRWLGGDLVGLDGAHACWLLVQDAATPQQRRAWLPWMQRAVLEGWANEGDLAFLDDRVAREAGRTQIHGTVTYGDPARLWPLAEPEKVPELCEMVQLPPLSDAEIANAWTFEELAWSVSARATPHGGRDPGAEETYAGITNIR